MIGEEGKGIPLLNARFLRTVNNTFPGEIFLSFPVIPILLSFGD